MTRIKQINWTLTSTGLEPLDIGGLRFIALGMILLHYKNLPHTSSEDGCPTEEASCPVYSGQVEGYSKHHLHITFQSFSTPVDIDFPEGSDNPPKTITTIYEVKIRVEPPKDDDDYDD